MAALDIDVCIPLRSFRLEVALAISRETFALVGPSGAGKSTLLRALAGLVRPERGRIALNGRTLFEPSARIDRPPEERRTAFVFQEYALFPHMSVAQNVAFGGRRHVKELLERFGIEHLANARPAELSGGERQRVGLARALASDPELLLLDEPLSALDPHTRARVRAELRGALRSLALPVLLVTHDFDDAAALADRLGVIVDGRLLQVGTAHDLIAAPADAYVASFTGANVLSGRATLGADGLTAIALDDGTTVYSVVEAHGPVEVAVYPWDIVVTHGGSRDSAMNHVRGPITSLVRFGNRARVEIGGLVGEITTASVERLELREGDIAVASFKAAATRVLPREPERRHVVS